MGAATLNRARPAANQAHATMADAAEHTGWGVLVAVGDKSSAAKHLDRSLDKKADVTNATLVGPDLELRLVKTVVGRMLMNAEGTARAITQVADILVDVPSGTRSLAPAPTLLPAPDPFRDRFADAFLAPQRLHPFSRSERQARGDNVRSRRR